MEKKFYTSEEIKNVLASLKFISGNEADIYLLDNEEVLKYFKCSAYYRNEENIEEIGTLDPNYLTIPTSLLYVDDKYAGFYMHNEGKTLRELILSEFIKKDTRIDFCYQLKDALKYLIEIDKFHGDIKLDNILVKDGKLKLCDINNLIMNNSRIRRNLLSEYWGEMYDSFRIADILLVNYLTFVLLNCDYFYLMDYVKRNALIDLTTMCKLTSKKNKKFDDDVWEYEKMVMQNRRPPKSLIYMPDLFLIDHLK